MRLPSGRDPAVAVALVVSVVYFTFLARRDGHPMTALTLPRASRLPA